MRFVVFTEWGVRTWVYQCILRFGCERACLIFRYTSTIQHAVGENTLLLFLVLSNANSIGEYKNKTNKENCMVRLHYLYMYMTPKFVSSHNDMGMFLILELGKGLGKG